MDYFDAYYEIKKEIIKEDIAQMILRNLDCWDLDLDSIANTQALTMLDEIRNVLMKEKSDRQAVTEIRQIFNNHRVSYEKSLLKK